MDEHMEREDYGARGPVKPTDASIEELTSRPPGSRRDREPGAGDATGGTGVGGVGGVAPGAAGTMSAANDTQEGPDASGEVTIDRKRASGPVDDVGGKGTSEAGMAGSGAAAPPDDYPIGPEGGTTGGA